MQISGRAKYSEDCFGDLSSLIGLAEALDIQHDPKLAPDRKSRKVSVQVVKAWLTQKARHSSELPLSTNATEPQNVWITQVSKPTLRFLKYNVNSWLNTARKSIKRSFAKSGSVEGSQGHFYHTCIKG